MRPKVSGLGILLWAGLSLGLLGCGSARPPSALADGPENATSDTATSDSMATDPGAAANAPIGAASPGSSSTSPAGDESSSEGNQAVSGLAPGNDAPSGNTPSGNTPGGGTPSGGTSNGSMPRSSSNGADPSPSAPSPSPAPPAAPAATPPPDGFGALVPCGVDATLPAEPKLPSSVCATLNATHTATSGVTPPNERTLDTARIQAAIDGCRAGRAVRLVTQGNANAFVSGPLALRAGVALWVDAGATLYASRQPALYGPDCGTVSGSCPAFIAVSGAGASIVGDGVIDGQGGEKMLDANLSEQALAWWEVSDSLRADGATAANPALIQTSDTSSRFTLYRITLHNSPKFHVRLAGSNFLVWGVTVFTPSTATNSHGTDLSPFHARNTDGIDPGAGGAVSNGYILYNKISVGDDQIAIKGSNDAGADYATQLVIAHNRFGSGHGMSIGSEVVGGVHDVTVCDLTIDNSLRSTGGSPASDINGIRVKSDPTRGGLVDSISYSDVCIREVNNPIVVDPFYSAETGNLPPVFTRLSFQNVRATSTGAQTITLFGLDPNHLTTLTLDNVNLEGPASSIEAQDTVVTIGSGGSSFAQSIGGSGVQVTGATTAVPTPIDCSARWASIP